MEPREMVQDAAPRQAGEKRWGLSAAALKGIAIAAMLCDHAAYVFVPQYYSTLGVVLHTIGRITGPVMFFFLVEGYHHTRNVNRYTLRLLVFAAVSYLPFIWFFTGSPLPTADTFLTFNVIYTLLLGHLCLRAIHEVKNLALQVVIVVAALVLSSFGDWYYLGVIIILLFDIFRGSFRNQALAYSMVVLLQLLPGISSLVRGLVQGYPYMMMAGLLPQTIVTAGMFLPLVLLGFYNGQRGRGSRWGFYIFYPAHLLVLAALHTLGGMGL